MTLKIIVRFYVVCLLSAALKVKWFEPQLRGYNYADYEWNSELYQPLSVDSNDENGRLDKRNARSFVSNRFQRLNKDEQEDSSLDSMDGRNQTDGNEETTEVTENTEETIATSTEMPKEEEMIDSEAEKELMNNITEIESNKNIFTGLGKKITNMWQCLTGNEDEPSEDQVKFYLFTSSNPQEPEELKINLDRIRKVRKRRTNRQTIECIEIPTDFVTHFRQIEIDRLVFIDSYLFNIDAPTKIIVHGYTGACTDDNMESIKDAYLSLSNYNVIMVNWEELAAPPCYIAVTRHARFVGHMIALLIDGLHLAGTNMSMVHLIGFSLGAQVSGFAGSNVTQVPVCRITGLDPALPLFFHKEPYNRLDRTDASFVDVIHTGGGILAVTDSLGHADFFPNGGTRQPGCDLSDLHCSHVRAQEYFTESILAPNSFLSTLCDSWESYVLGKCNDSKQLYMGEGCAFESTPGNYYLTTNDKEPFSKNED